MHCAYFLEDRHKDKCIKSINVIKGFFVYTPSRSFVIAIIRSELSHCALEKQFHLIFVCVIYTVKNHAN